MRLIEIQCIIDQWLNEWHGHMFMGAPPPLPKDGPQDTLKTDEKTAGYLLGKDFSKIC